MSYTTSKFKIPAGWGDGTSFHDVRVNATVEEIEEILGEADYASNCGEDKTNFDWCRELEDGTIFTVYDWKYYRPLSMYENVEFHIGAKNFIDSMKAKKALEKELNKIR